MFKIKLLSNAEADSATDFSTTTIEVTES